jgi:hypothetical protein
MIIYKMSNRIDEDEDKIQEILVNIRKEVAKYDNSFELWEAAENFGKFVITELEEANLIKYKED